MSAEAGPLTDLDPADTDDRERMIAILDELLEESLRKVRSGRVYDAENERTRIKWIRIAKDLIDVRRKVTNDRDLDELADEVEQIKAGQRGS